MKNIAILNHPDLTGVVPLLSQNLGKWLESLTLNSGDFGLIPLLKPMIWGDYSAGTGGIRAFNIFMKIWAPQLRRGGQPNHPSGYTPWN